MVIPPPECWGESAWRWCEVWRDRPVRSVGLAHSRPGWFAVTADWSGSGTRTTAPSRRWSRKPTKHDWDQYKVSPASLPPTCPRARARFVAENSVLNSPSERVRARAGSGSFTPGLREFQSRDPPTQPTVWKISWKRGESVLSVSVGTNVKPPDDDSLQLEVVACEARHCSSQITGLKHSCLVIATNLQNTNSQRRMETDGDS